MDENEKIILLIRYMARDGLCEDEIAKKLNITKTRLKNILKQNKELARELELEKLMTLAKVEDALLKKALGSTAVEIKETEKTTGVERVRVTKEVPADTSALQFWLKNRYPERWRDNGYENKETSEKLEEILNNISVLAEDVLGDEEYPKNKREV